MKCTTSIPSIFSIKPEKYLCGGVRSAADGRQIFGRDVGDGTDFVYEF